MCDPETAIVRLRGALADEAPLGGDQRTVARLASLVVPVGFVTLVMIAIGVGSRIEGGFRVGDGRFRTDSAVHSVVELLQPPLVIAVVGAAAIATGRWVFRAGPAIVIGVVVLFMTGSVYWMWNAEYAYSTALMQVHPLGDLEVVHTPTVMLHDLYLLGLVGLFVGLSLRDASRPAVGRGRRGAGRCCPSLHNSRCHPCEYSNDRCSAGSRRNSPAVRSVSSLGSRRGAWLAAWRSGSASC